MDVGLSFQLKVRDKDNVLCDLPLLDGSTAKEILRVYLSPDGKDTKQLSVLVDKVRVWIDYIRVSGLDWGSPWIALNTTILKSLKYPLSAMIFTPQQIFSITGPNYKVALP